jgi:hypothetical protein
VWKFEKDPFHAAPLFNLKFHIRPKWVKPARSPKQHLHQPKTKWLQAHTGRYLYHVNDYRFLNISSYRN